MRWTAILPRALTPTVLAATFAGALWLAGGALGADALPARSPSAPLEGPAATPVLATATAREPTAAQAPPAGSGRADGEDRVPTLAPFGVLAGASAVPVDARAATGPLRALGVDSARPPSPPRPLLVAALGDSLTDARSHGGAYLAPITASCASARVDNQGKGADMVNQMRRRFAATILPSPTPYTHLVVFGGVNDLYSDQTAGRTPEKVAQDLLWIYGRARARGMTVVALTVAPWGGFTRYFNAKRGADTRRLNGWIREQFADGTVDYVVDAYAILSCGNPDFLCRDYSIDGIHFNAKGHAALGEALRATAFADCR